MKTSPLALALSCFLALTLARQSQAQTEEHDHDHENASTVAKESAPKKGISSFAAALGASLKAPPMPVTSFFAPGRLWKRLGIQSRPKRGEWAEYDMYEGGVPVGRLKVSVLPGNRPKNLILEIRTLTAGGPSYVKLLLKGGLDQPDNIERVMMAQPGIPPMELPLIGLDAKSRKAQTKQIEAAVDRMKITFRGKVKLEVPAGEYLARYTVLEPPEESVGIETTEFWTNPEKVLALGLVAWTRGGASYRLASQGTGAKSDLVPFPMMAPAAVDPADVQIEVRTDDPQGKGKARAK